MTKEELMKKAREVFTAGIRMIDDNDLSSSLEKAQEFWAEQKSKYCTNAQEEGWWDIGFHYETEEKKAEFDAWNESYWALARTLSESGISEEASDKILWMWNEEWCKEKYGHLKIERNLA